MQHCGEGPYGSMREKILHGQLRCKNGIMGLKLGQVGVHGRGVPVHLALGDQFSNSCGCKCFCYRSKHGQSLRMRNVRKKIVESIKRQSACTTHILMLLTSGVKGSFLFLLPKPSAKMSFPLWMIATPIPGTAVWFLASSRSFCNFARIAVVFPRSAKNWRLFKNVNIISWTITLKIGSQSKYLLDSGSTAWTTDAYWSISAAVRTRKRFTMFVRMNGDGEGCSFLKKTNEKCEIFICRARKRVTSTFLNE